MTSLLDAVEALDARKISAFGEDRRRAVDDQTLACITVGLDIDRGELHACSTAYATLGLEMLAAFGAGEVMGVLKGAWTDGLATGLLLAELRLRDETREAA